MHTFGDVEEIVTGAPAASSGHDSAGAGPRARARTAGFTLIELLVVIAIIGILSAVAIPQFGAYRRKGFDADALANVRNMALAQEAYFLENNTYADDHADLVAYGYTQSVNITPEVTDATDTEFVVTATVNEGCRSTTGIATYTQQTGQVTLVNCSR